jgi:hypothetical protein
MRYFTVWLVAFVVLPILWSLFRGRARFRKKALLIADYIQKRGYVLLNPSAATFADTPIREIVKHLPAGGLTRASEGLTDIKTFERGTDDVALAMVCRLRGQEVTIFNFSSDPGINTANTASGGSVRYRVAKVRHEGLPLFSLGRHSIVEKVEKVVDHMVGIPDLNLDQGNFPGFFRKYWLKGRDAAAVYAFLSPVKLEFLEREGVAGSIAANAQYLVYFEDGTMRTEEDYDRFIAVADGLIAHLL